MRSRGIRRCRVSPPCRTPGRRFGCPRRCSCSGSVRTTASGSRSVVRPERRLGSPTFRRSRSRSRSRLSPPRLSPPRLSPPRPSPPSRERDRDRRFDRFRDVSCKVASQLAAGINERASASISPPVLQRSLLKLPWFATTATQNYRACTRLTKEPVYHGVKLGNT